MAQPAAKSRDTLVLDQAFAWLDQLTDRTVLAGPVADDQLARFEQQSQQSLPSQLRQFIARFGAVATRAEYQLFGLGVPPHGSPSIQWAWRWLHLNSPDAPAGLIPIGAAGEHRFACLLGQEALPKDDWPVIAWQLGQPATEQSMPTLAPSYAAYLQGVAWELWALDQALTTLRSRIEEQDQCFQYEHDGKGKLPRDHNWRAYRFCSQDIILGAHVQRHVKGDNCLEVDVFLPIDVWPFEPGASLLGLTVSILADAYRCGGSMEIRFTNNVDGGQLPRKLQALATALNATIKPASISRRRLDPDDSRRLFLALTDFSPPVQALLSASSQRPERACFAVQRGIWPKPEAEALLLSHPDPDRVFAGGSPPEQRLLFMEDLLHTRAAILAGYLDRALSLRERELSATEALELEDDVRDVETGFEPQAQARIYGVRPAAGETEAEFLLPWLADGCHAPDRLPFGEDFIVLIRARSPVDMARHAAADLERAGRLRSSRGRPTYVLFAQDWYDPALEQQRAAWLRQANQMNVGVLICAEAVEGLEDEAARRFTSARMVRA